MQPLPSLTHTTDTPTRQFPFQVQALHHSQDALESAQLIRESAAFCSGVLAAIGTCLIDDAMKRKPPPAQGSLRLLKFILHVPIKKCTI